MKKTSMFKKAIRNTAIISLILVNLFLWPYLYFEITGTDEQPEEVRVSGNQYKDRVKDSPEVELEVSEPEEVEATSEEKMKIFKIDRIE